MSMVAQRVQEQEQHNKQQPEKRIRQVRNTITLGEKMIGGMVVLFSIIFLCLTVNNYATIYSMNREVVQLQGTVHQQTQINEGLNLQVVELSAPDRILHIASEKLGMSLDDNKVKVVQN
ncbi:cell division protein FtsL [Halalkalibacter akibai]|uniref:Cell division protein FtsL n=1 Tax=Halalkalibacter akibai (strain ATCC 43226 / DSM 21942 / CIP 109018 / JCM 9157 / 1139) TaxID=1236973 RepID=W4QP11_HALA3|nr:cell division protein FtsL [Halalkalibacter akibai]GAE33850.1 cell division protein FtsL [Halalkalibacter akibai JCM 9157]